MVTAQALVALTAIGICAAFSRRIRIAPAACERSDEGPGIGSIWGLGMVQLASVVGLNAAGWWIASLVARGDVTLAQMRLFAIAGQCRNIASLVLGLLTQSSYSLLAEQSGLGRCRCTRMHADKRLLPASHRR
jgi:hypothetical protein